MEIKNTINMKNEINTKMTNPPIPCGKSPGALVGGLEPLPKGYRKQGDFAIKLCITKYG